MTAAPFEEKKKNKLSPHFSIPRYLYLISSLVVISTRLSCIVYTGDLLNQEPDTSGECWRVAMGEASKVDDVLRWE